MLKTILGNLSQEKIIEEFDKQLVKKGKFAPQHLRILKDLAHARTEFKKGKSNLHKIDEARKNASILINDIIEYNQRCEILDNNRANKSNKKIE